MLKIKNAKNSKTMKWCIIIILFVLLFLIHKKIKNIIYTYDDSTYFTTWTASIHPTKSPPIKLDNNSIRQIIRVSSSGEKIRIKFSNLLGKNDLVIKKVSIADIVSNSEVNMKTMKYITFMGKKGLVIGKGEEIYSDTIFYPLKEISDIAISIYFGSVPKAISGHVYSLTYSYIEIGNKINKKIFSQNKKTPHWYFISAIEVSSESPKKTIVCFGDSITDGVKFNNEFRYNYPDLLFYKLLQNKETSNLSIANQGINANRLVDQGVERYESDVLDVKGVAYIIVLYGVNDLNVIEANSQEIIEGYKQIIKKAHERNLLIYAGTIIPFGNYQKYKYKWNKEKEKVRQETNDWIRKTKPENGGFDAFFDFDKLLKDPKNETVMKDEYDSGDGIHPSLEGNKKMVESIDDLTLFTKK